MDLHNKECIFQRRVTQFVIKILNYFSNQNDISGNTLGVRVCVFLGGGDPGSVQCCCVLCGSVQYFVLGCFFKSI